MAPLKNILAITLTILGVASLLAAIGLFITRPYLLNGSACELTIDSVGVNSEGTIWIRYHGLIAYNTEVVPVAPIRRGDVTCVDREPWNKLPPRFDRWARKLEGGQRGFNADRSPARTEAGEETSPDFDWLRAGITLKPGIYHIRPGEELEYFRNRNQDGAELVGRIHIESTSGN